MDAIIHGQVIYESSRAARFEFEQRMMMFYADFKSLLNEFDREILQGFEIQYRSGRPPNKTADK